MSHPTETTQEAPKTNKPTPVVTQDETYIQGIKIYGAGIKEDPIPGEKRGKGVQHLNSSYWMTDMGNFIGNNIEVLQKILKKAQNKDNDYQFLLNLCNFHFMNAENGGLRTKESCNEFLLASWLCMAAAEVDQYGFTKYSKDERAQYKKKFYDNILSQKPSLGEDVEGENCRIDLIPSIALERLGIHNELCAIKWKDPTVWKREGFIISKRIDSLKRHLDSCHMVDQSEDHIAHLTWNFMAIWHVLKVFPQMNDLCDFEIIKKKNESL